MALKAIEIHITAPEQHSHSFNLLESLSGVYHVVDHDDGAPGDGSRHGGQPLDVRTKKDNINTVQLIAKIGLYHSSWRSLTRQF